MRRQNDRFALPTARGTPLDLRSRITGRGESVESDRRWLKNVPRPWAVDLFAGAGGLSLGLQEAGFRVIAAADHDERAIETHAANLHGMTWALDLSEPEAFIERLRRRGVRTVDLVAGGPPCQPFSRAGAAKLRSLVASGNREPDHERINLWQTFLGVIDALKPRAVVLENVPDMARWSDGEILVNLMTALRERGLEPDARVLNAWEYGVPQHRARLFVVATRRLEFTWPRRRPLVTLADAIGDLPVIPPAQRERSLPYVGQPSTPFQRKARRGMAGRRTKIVWDHCSRDVRADDAEAFALLPQGGTYIDLPSRLRRYRSDIFDDKYKRLSWGDVSRTITAHIAKDGYWYIHPDQDRTLSIREAARIQTFPDRFRFAGHPSAQLRQIGNAVPPALARAVGRRVFAALAHRQRARYPRASDRLRAWLPPDEAVDPWLVAVDPWLVLAGELTLRRASRAVATRGWAALLRSARTPRNAVEDGRLKGELAAAGVAPSRYGALLAVARSIVVNYGGQTPSTEAELLKLPGIGESVATAVRSFGFKQRAILLDTASRRLVARVSGHECSSSWTTRLELHRLAGMHGPTREFNLTIRAITRTCCVPREPVCGVCPMAGACRSFAAPSVKTRNLAPT
jgi:DNA (cytosine-5)-methyltransferase 1